MEQELLNTNQARKHPHSLDSTITKVCGLQYQCRECYFAMFHSGFDGLSSGKDKWRTSTMALDAVLTSAILAPHIVSQMSIMSLNSSHLRTGGLRNGVHMHVHRCNNRCSGVKLVSVFVPIPIKAHPSKEAMVSTRYCYSLP